MNTPNDALPWRDLARVGTAILGLFLAFGCLLPVLPLWAEAKLGRFTDVGFVVTLAVGLGLILGRPIAARMMEGRPRAPTIVAGTLLCSASALAFPFLSDIWPIFTLRMVQGVGFGMVTTAGVSLITDLSPPTRRGQVLGYYGASNAISLIAGPALGAAVARHWHLDSAFWLAGTLGILPLFALVGLKEPAKPRVPGRLRLLEALTLPHLKPLVLAHFLVLMVHGAQLTFLPAQLKHNPGWMTTEWFYAIDGMALILLRVGVGRRFDSFGRGPFIYGGALLILAAAVLLGQGTGDAAWCAAAILYGLGFGAYVPASNALAGDVVPETHRARGFAFFLLAFDLSMACGGAAFGPLADAWSPAVALTAAAGTTALGALVYVAIRKTVSQGQGGRKLQTAPR